MKYIEVHSLKKVCKIFSMFYPVHIITAKTDGLSRYILVGAQLYKLIQGYYAAPPARL